MEQKKFTFNEILRNLGESSVLPKEMIAENEIAKTELNNFGISPTAEFYFNKRSINIIPNPLNTYSQVKTDYIYNFNKVNDIFNKAYYLENVVYDCKVPYFSYTGFDWKDIGYSPSISDPNITSLEMKPYRVVAQTKVSKTILKQNKDFQKQFSSILIKALEDKVINTMLSDDAGSDDKPAGIFNGITPVSITSTDDLLDAMAVLDQNNMNCEWIVSGAAKSNIIKLYQDYKMLDSGKLFGSVANIEPLMKNGYVAYLDFSKLVITNWNYYGITMDSFTDAHNNNYIFTIEGFYDFKYLNSQYLKVLNFSE